MKPFLTPRRAILGALALALLPAAFPAGLRAQDDLPAAGEIIDRYVDAIGGRDAVLSAPGTHSTGAFSMPAAGLEAKMEIYAATEPSRMVSVIEIPGMGIIRNGYTGEYGWSVDPNLGPRLLEGMELESMREGASNAASLRDPSLFDERTTVERTEMNGEACYKVRLVWKSGRETFDCYSVDSGLLVASQSNEETPMGTIPVITLISDYEKFGDVLSPTRIVQQMMGQEQVITIETVEYGEIEAERFDPPASIQTLIDQKAAEQ